MLPPLLRVLASAATRGPAEAAARQIEGITLNLKMLSESSAAVASSLVHALWGCANEARPSILELLSTIAASEDDFYGKEAVGPVSLADCMQYIDMGFPLYCEVLEASDDESEVVSAIDLVTCCGDSNPFLKPIAKYVLEVARGRYSSSDLAELIDNSIAGLC
jgi:hypothetical protein